MKNQSSNTFRKNLQLILIIVVILTTLLLAGILLLNKPQPSDNSEEKEASSATERAEKGEEHAEEAEHEHPTASVIKLSNAQIASQQLKIEQVIKGNIDQQVQLAGRLVVNTDQQAHVSPSFAGRVDAVYVQTGQHVKKGQALASLVVPELVDMQGNLSTLEAKQVLALTEYQREKTLWQQGISAKQDYLQADSQYKQVQIEVNAARSRLNAYGASSQGGGRFTITAPISGVIQNKAVVTGESVQTAAQLFVIDRLDQLWLEFTVPIQLADQLTQQFIQGQPVSFATSPTGQYFTAKLQSVTPTADVQTGRLIARAVVNNEQLQLRPNMLVNVKITQQAKGTGNSLIIQRTAIQQVNNQAIVFVAEPNKDGMHFSPKPVTVDEGNSNGEWVVIQQGLTVGQQYVTDGSFILKSELEKGAGDDDE